MDGERVSADFYTSHHRLRGFVDTRNQRLTDYLNDSLYSTIRVHELEVSRLTEPQRTVFRAPHATVTKSRIILVGFPERPRDYSTERIFKFVEKRPHDVVLTAPPFEVQGQLHLRGTGRLTTLLFREPGNFMPLTKATAVFSLFPDVAVRSQVIIVNREYLEAIGPFDTAESPELDKPRARGWSASDS